MTETCPVPPPLAFGAVGLVLAVGLDAGAVSAVFACGVAASVPVAAAAEPQVPTPPWPRQAPEREVPEKDEPSLQVAVTLAVDCA